MREPGFYWVKLDENHWTIAEWYGTFWKTSWSIHNKLMDKRFEEIDERRIVRDDEIEVTFFSLEDHLKKRIEQFAHDTIELYKKAEKG
jgi:hypothetical protein